MPGGSVGPVDWYVFEHGHNDAGIEYDYDSIYSEPPSPFDRTYYLGAMRFLIDKIRERNPDAKICLVGHYENDNKVGVAKAQLLLADRLGLTLCRTWDMLDWTQEKITKNGVTKTVTQWLMPDDLHPHSDKTGNAMKQYTDVLISFFRTLN